MPDSNWGSECDDDNDIKYHKSNKMSNIVAESLIPLLTETNLLIYKPSFLQPISIIVIFLQVITGSFFFHSKSLIFPRMFELYLNIIFFGFSEKNFSRSLKWIIFVADLLAFVLVTAIVLDYYYTRNIKKNLLKVLKLWNCDLMNMLIIPNILQCASSLTHYGTEPGLYTGTWFVVSIFAISFSMINTTMISTVLKENPYIYNSFYFLWRFKPFFEIIILCSIPMAILVLYENLFSINSWEAKIIPGIISLLISPLIYISLSTNPFRKNVINALCFSLPAFVASCGIVHLVFSLIFMNQFKIIIIRFLSPILILIIVHIISMIFLNKRDKKIGEMLNQDDFDIEIAKFLKRSRRNRFLALQIGLKKKCHQYLNYQLFYFLLENYSSDNTLVLFITQLSSFIPSEKQFFYNCLIQCKKLKVSTFLEKCLFNQFLRIFNFREMHSSAQSRADLINITKMTDRMVSYPYLFWKTAIHDKKEINDGIFTDISEEIKKCDSEWQEILEKYPNNHRFKEEYSRYLLDAKSSYLESVLMYQNFLHGNKITDQIFYCFLQSYPDYLKKGIVDVNGRFCIKNEAIALSNINLIIYKSNDSADANDIICSPKGFENDNDKTDNTSDSEVLKHGSKMKLVDKFNKSNTSTSSSNGMIISSNDEIDDEKNSDVDNQIASDFLKDYKLKFAFENSMKRNKLDVTRNMKILSIIRTIIIDIFLGIVFALTIADKSNDEIFQCLTNFEKVTRKIELLMIETTIKLVNSFKTSSSNLKIISMSTNLNQNISKRNVKSEEKVENTSNLYLDAHESLKQFEIYITEMYKMTENKRMDILKYLYADEKSKIDHCINSVPSNYSSTRHSMYILYIKYVIELTRDNDTKKWIKSNNLCSLMMANSQIFDSLQSFFKLISPSINDSFITDEENATESKILLSSYPDNKQKKNLINNQNYNKNMNNGGFQADGFKKRQYELNKMVKQITKTIEKELLCDEDQKAIMNFKLRGLSKYNNRRIKHVPKNDKKSTNIIKILAIDNLILDKKVNKYFIPDNDTNLPDVCYSREERQNKQKNLKEKSFLKKHIKENGENKELILKEINNNIKSFLKTGADNDLLNFFIAFVPFITFIISLPTLIFSSTVLKYERMKMVDLLMEVSKEEMKKASIPIKGIRDDKERATLKSSNNADHWWVWIFLVATIQCLFVMASSILAQNYDNYQNVLIQHILWTTLQRCALMSMANNAILSVFANEIQTNGIIGGDGSVINNVNFIDLDLTKENLKKTIDTYNKLTNLIYDGSPKNNVPSAINFASLVDNEKQKSHCYNDDIINCFSFDRITNYLSNLCKNVLNGVFLYDLNSAELLEIEEIAYIRLGKSYEKLTKAYVQSFNEIVAFEITLDSILLIVGLVCSFFSLWVELYLLNKFLRVLSVFKMLFLRVDPIYFISNRNFLSLLYSTNKEKRIISSSHAMFQTASDGIIFLDESLLVENVNPAVTKIFGFPPEQLLGQNINFFLKENVSNKINYIKNLMHNGEASLIYETDATGIKDDGSDVPLKMTLIGMSKNKNYDINEIYSTSSISQQNLEKDNNISKKEIKENNLVSTKKRNAITNIRIDYYAMLLIDMTEEHRQTLAVQEAKKQSEIILLQILPKDIIRRLNMGEKNITFTVPSATIIFIDIEKFSKYSETLSATEIMLNLSKIFTAFDKICSTFPLITKIKLIGDDYMAAAGLFNTAETSEDYITPKRHAIQVLQFAQQCLSSLEDMNFQLHSNLQARVGINTDGPLIAGVLGTDRPMFDIIGDPINVAARLQSTDIPGLVQISEGTYNLVCDMNVQIEERGMIELKGKGQRKTYLVYPDEAMNDTFSGSMAVKGTTDVGFESSAILKQILQKSSSSIMFMSETPKE